MGPPNRERILGAIAELQGTIGTLERELATIADGEDNAPTLVTAGHVAPGETVVQGRSPAARSNAQGAPGTSTAPNIEMGFSDRYTSGGEALGQGGMGEVLLSTDRRIGRAIAMKVIRADAARVPKLRARFLFEAKIQGQLEHPSIVPVYDLGVRPDGIEYFTMKRVHGRTLHEVLKALGAGDKRTEVAFTRRKLLTALQGACLAMEFSHQRGVVHRDLKPANLMLGSLGEISVLDWGLAKVSRFDRAITPTPDAEAALDEARADQETAVGEILGTPGYMSPEQAAGAGDVDARSDVFALGAMLFEILTLKHLVPGQTSAEIGRATLLGKYDARISERFPDLDIPPELETACVRATSHEKKHRMASAMELHDAIERYLEGDRDVERRRSIAGKHTRAAIRALAELGEARDATAARDARARAVREVTRALAIDPENATALRMMMRLMTDDAAPATPEAEAAVTLIQSVSRRKVARRGTLAFLLCASYLGLVALLGVRDWTAIGAAAGFFFAAAALAFAASRRADIGDRQGTALTILVLSSIAIAIASSFFGPFLYVPSLCAANVVVFAAGVDRRSRFVGAAIGVSAAVVPFALEQVGVVSTSWGAWGDHLVVSARAISFPPRTTEIVLLLETIGTILAPALIVGAERDARVKAERQLAVQAQRFAEFIPNEARPNATS